MRKKGEHHHWTTDDDLLALYVYRFGDTQLPIKKRDLPARLGMNDAAFPMRIANFRALDTGSGLANASRQTRDVFDEHRDTPEPALRRLALAALG